MSRDQEFDGAFYLSWTSAQITVTLCPCRQIITYKHRPTRLQGPVTLSDRSCWSWSWSSSCGRQTVDQFVLVSGLPLKPSTRFYLVLLFSADNYLIILSMASSLTRKRVCSLQWNHPLVPITILYCLIRDCVPFLSPLTTRRDYGGGIQTRLHTGKELLNLDKRHMTSERVPRMGHGLYRSCSAPGLTQGDSHNSPLIFP
jgi:hypothetical protein